MALNASFEQLSAGKFACLRSLAPPTIFELFVDTDDMDYISATILRVGRVFEIRLHTERLRAEIVRSGTVVNILVRKRVLNTSMCQWLHVLACSY